LQYISKIIIPQSEVMFITKEKTAKMFPNAIGIQLAEGSKHVFGSFMSRESAFALMVSLLKKTQQLSIEPALDEPEDDIDGVQALQDVEVSSIEDSSSISGSESPAQYRIPTVIVDDAIEEKTLEEEATSLLSPNLAATTTTCLESPPPMPVTTSKGSQKETSSFKFLNEFNFLIVGIGLTIALAFFSGLMLIKINSIESSHHHNHHLHHHPDNHDESISIEMAESILNKNLLVVRGVREQLEGLQSMLQQSFEKMPYIYDKQEL